MTLEEKLNYIFKMTNSNPVNDLYKENIIKDTILDVIREQSNSPKLTRRRTTDQCYEQLRKDDPGCCVSKHLIRKLVREGKVKYFKAGAKYLVDYDDLCRYISNNNSVSNQDDNIQCGVIRKVQE